jgi:hypothetical protein
VIDLAKKKKKTFPSQIKYGKKNPTVSFRLKRVDYENLKTVSEMNGKPIAQFVREIVLGVNDEESGSYNSGYEHGYDNAMGIDHFRIPCSKCGKPIVFTSKDEVWEPVVKPTLYKAFSNWHHITCPSVIAI